MKHNRETCVNCNKNRILKSDNLCIRCHSKQSKCINCNRKKRLDENNKLCKGCSSTQFQNVVRSGNQDIDNLIKATYKNQLKFRLEWIPFNDFTDITQIGTGGFSEIYTATWTKGEITGWSSTKNEYNRRRN